MREATQMATRQPREASAADVRAWAMEQNWTDSSGNAVGERGRFSSELVEAFNKAHKRNNTVYQGGGGSAGNSRSSAPATRATSRTSDSTPSTRRAPARTPQRQAATASSGSGEGGVNTALITPSGAGGMSPQQMEQFTRMLADANAVTGQQNELTFVHIGPAAVAS